MKILEASTDLWEQFTTGVKVADKKRIDKNLLKPNFPKSTWGQSLRWENSLRSSGSGQIQNVSSNKALPKARESQISATI